MANSRDFAVITDNFPPCAGGGIAEWAYGIAENLVSMGHRVTVISRWRKGVETSAHDDKGFKLRCMFGRDWKTYRYWYALFHSWQYLKENPEAIVLATTWELGHPMVFLKRFFPKAILVVIAHGREVTQLKKGRRVKQFQKTISNALVTFAVSRFTRQEILDRLGNKQLPVLFLPNAVNIERFHPADDYQDVLQKLGLSGNNKIILTLARVIERKGHDTVIRALPKIIKQFPETVYVIAGPWKDPYYQKLQALIDELDLKNHVVFTSFVSDEDLTKYYSMSDVYVMVSRTIETSGDSEGFGITFLEANACLCPVIGSYSGGIPDAVEDGVSGFLVQPDDPETLSEKILSLFKDESFRQRMAEQGRKRVEERFTWEKITAELVRHIRAGLNKS